MISVVIPVYNAESSLIELYQGLKAALGEECEFIFVDDGSTDASGNTLRELARSDGAVRVVCMAENCGQQEATLCGLAHASGEYVATMDADGQHPPEQLLTMTARLMAGELDIVYAVPANGRRRLGAGMRDMLFFILFPRSRGCRVSSYRVMTNELARRVAGQRKAFNYFSAMVFSQPVKAAHITYSAIYIDGASSYTFLKRLRLFTGILLHYGPLKALFNRPAGDFCVKERMGFD